MSRLHQLQLAYAPVEDRLLFRLKTQDMTEIRLWLTRRLVARLWQPLLDQLAGNEQVLRQEDPEAKKSVLQFQHEQAVAQSNFGQKFEEKVEALPLGTAPILVSKVQIKPGGAGKRTLCFYPEKGQGVELAMDDRLLHSFCKLLADATAKADWALQAAVAPDPGAYVRPEGKAIN